METRSKERFIKLKDVLYVLKSQQENTPWVRNPRKQMEDTHFSLYKKKSL